MRACALVLEHVGAVGEQLARCRIECDGHVVARTVPGRLDTGNENLRGRLVGVEIGSESASSPTAVPSPRSWRMPLSAWNTSVPVRNASANEAAPTGTIMNSLKSILLSACTPPFRTFIIGTGSTCAASPPR